MSQRKNKPTSEEAIAQREAAEAEANKVVPFPGTENLPDFQPDAIGGPVIDDPDLKTNIPGPEVLAEFLRTAVQPVQAECPYCGKQMLLELPGDTDPGTLMQKAAMNCDCPEAKIDQQGSTIGQKIDMLFGEGSTKYGFPAVVSEDEVTLIKQFAFYVVDGTIKSVSITLNNGEKAVILTVKDATKVRRTKATKAEAEA